MNVLHIDGRFKPGKHCSVSADQELCEVPLDVRLFAECPVVHVCELLKHGGFQTLAESRKGFFRRKICKQRIRILTVDVDLFELRKLRAELQRAELMDLVLAAGRLVCELGCTDSVGTEVTP